jgi:hypothetical protein
MLVSSIASCCFLRCDQVPRPPCSDLQYADIVRMMSGCDIQKLCNDKLSTFGTEVVRLKCKQLMAQAYAVVQQCLLARRR